MLAAPVKPLHDCRLYTFIDTAYLAGRDPALVAQQLCDGGSDLIQLRAKNSPPAEVRRMAAAIQPITRRAGVWLVVNDHLDIARGVGADLCHLGQEDFFDAGHKHVSELRLGFAEQPTPCPSQEGKPKAGAARSPAPLLGGVGGGFGNPQIRIGLSTHAPAQCERAVAAGADYVAIGPVYPTGTKPGAKPVTLEYVRWAAANVSAPWFAIGGINLTTLDDVLAAGAQRICVVSAILNAPDIAAECRKFRARLS
jgi:thiamine-phosphate pyrophosphorylase